MFQRHSVKTREVKRTVKNEFFPRGLAQGVKSKDHGSRKEVKKGKKCGEVRRNISVLLEGDYCQKGRRGG